MDNTLSITAKPISHRYVCGFVFDETFENVLLLRKAKPKWQAGKYNGIGGKIEESDNSPVHAMKRECYEETKGLLVPTDCWDNFLTLYVPDNDGCLIEFFVTTVGYDDMLATQKATLGDTEPISIFDVNNLPDNIIDGIKWKVPMAADMRIKHVDMELEVAARTPPHILTR